MGWDAKKEKVAFGTVGFELEMCVLGDVGGNGPAWSQRYIRMKAKDTNAALSPDDQAEKTFDGNALSSVMTYTTDNHHHFNDVIEVKLPHATYLWGVLTDFLGQDSDLTCTLKKKCFAYRYGEGAWVKGKVPPAPVD